MSSINWNSIMNKVDKCISSNAMQKKINKEIDDIMLGKKISENGVKSVDMAARALIDVLEYEINNAPSDALSDGVKEAISSFNHTSPKKIGTRKYYVNVYFDKELSRPSLDPATYGYIDDLAVLYNDGVDHVMPQIGGEWHGKYVLSRTKILGYDFLGKTVDDFLANYQKGYNVTSLKLNK